MKNKVFSKTQSLRQYIRNKRTRATTTNQQRHQRQQTTQCRFTYGSAGHSSLMKTLQITTTTKLKNKEDEMKIKHRTHVNSFLCGRATVSTSQRLKTRADT